MLREHLLSHSDCIRKLCIESILQFPFEANVSLVMTYIFHLPIRGERVENLTTKQ